MFVALTDQRDGHDFVADALKKGAGAAMVSRVPDGVPADASLLIVDDVLDALQALGQAGRARFTGKVAAVTGSVGKTSTKDMLRAVLARQGQVHAAVASFNNHWGVPITLARMPINADFAIIEIGMSHPGEIAPLAKLAKPHVAMVTTVAAAHLEAFENIEGIAHEKAAIMDGLEPGGIAVLNGDIPTSHILTAKAKEIGVAARMFGEAATNTYSLEDVQISGNTTSVKAALPDDTVLFRVNSAGRHFATNALGVLAVVDALGADVALAARDMMQWTPPAGRSSRTTLALDAVESEMTIELIDDAFNANPTSMAAALEVLAASKPIDGIGRVRKGRRIAVLGDMLELGPDEAAEHEVIARSPFMEQIDIVHCAGPRMRALWDALPEHKRGEWHDAADKLAARAHHIVDAGDVVLVKGSKGSYVSLVVDAIRKLGHPVPNDNEGS